MKMGRRRRGGGSLPSTDFERVLRRHIESCNRHKYATVDEIVSQLHSNFPGYSRQKLQPFTTTVQKTLEHIKSTSITSSHPSTSNFVFDEEEEEDESARKKVKRIDASEERLQRLENQHIRRKRIGIIDQLSSSSESESESADGAVSTSKDAIYGEKLEPEFDLMKSMLRASYSESKDAENLKENVEEELIVNNKADDKVDLLEGDMKRFEKGLNGDGDGDGGSGGGGGGGEEVKEKDGPRFRDLGGMSGVVEELKMEVIVPLYHPQLPRWLGVRPMAGILLHGPPGCGKTKLAHAIANETGVPFYKISATELVSGVSENIRDLFTKAYRTAPSIVFIDEIDAIASKRENLQTEMERKIVTQLMTCMDESHRLVQPVDANTNAESVPDENARVEILLALTRNLRLEGSFDLVKIARSTPGFVGADLAALANKAGNLAMKRIIDRRKSDLSGEPTHVDHTEDWWRHPWLPEEMENLSITVADFEEAAKMVQPSSRREGFSAIPNVKWGDVGGLHLLRKEFDRYIVRCIKYPEDYEGFGVDLETGFLLYGPPGCGKTLIAKAGANFIHIKGPELLNKYVGESELAVRTIFSRARTCAPCILFFDESLLSVFLTCAHLSLQHLHVDALTTKRGKKGGWVVERLLNQLLIELDGADQRRGVFVIGATNRMHTRPEVMDRAVLRPGRFGKLLYVPLPSPDERGLILKALARKKPIDSSVDLIAIGSDEDCENLSGADLSALMNEAAMAALEEKLTAQSSSDADHPTSLTIKKTHFEQALKNISPSVSDKKASKRHESKRSGSIPIVWDLISLSSCMPSFISSWWIIFQPVVSEREDSSPTREKPGFLNHDQLRSPSINRSCVVVLNL
ncbi:hypothetical protein TEA_017142 [Camellia sinensis var. sinensis]|uniref:AAA+ ATPase domain-containing protein n=1 Tax=Camellia sinensis var. sinensis TaxID=542762 RepID=A0A4S4END8_CAMSN|nr:hypothetical protein TEA_017142 [Camellia sinensis var. sinensis]